jgi:predicted ATPase
MSRRCSSPDSVLPDYPDVVSLVELAALQDAALIAQALADVVGAREQPGATATLVASPRRRRPLLVLDNREHRRVGPQVAVAVRRVGSTMALGAASSA